MNVNFKKFMQVQDYFAQSLKKYPKSKIITASCVAAALIVLLVAVATFGIMPVVSLICLMLAGVALASIAGFEVLQLNSLLKHVVMKYNDTPQNLQLPNGTTPKELMNALVRKFDYPYCKGIHYDLAGECAVQGRYGLYVLTPSGIGRDLSIDPKKVKKLKQHFAFMEAITIRSFLNRFFNQDSLDDVKEDLAAQNFVVQKVKTTGLVIVAALLGLLGVVCFTPGVLGNFKSAASLVQKAYLTEYSTTATVGATFDSFFANPKWETQGDTAVFTGTGTVFGKKSNVTVTFQRPNTKARTLSNEDVSVEINGERLNDFLRDLLLESIYGIED